MRSRVLLGVGAWLLGATMATAGSLYAVGQLGNSLFAVPTKPLSIKVVNADLAREPAKNAKPLKPAHHPDTSHPRSNAGRHHVSPSHRSSPAPTSSSSPPAGVFLSSADGSAQADCEAGLARLLYWYPQPGYEAEGFNPGPAAVAYVSFTNDFGGILMRVTCQGGVPVKHLSNVPPERGGGH